MEVKKKMKKEKRNYRLGIDMGSTSIGWCMLELDKDNNPCGIINLGVRIFPDGRDDKSKEPLSAARRTYRGMRRNLDRYLMRRQAVLDFFDRQGWLPQTDPERKQVFLLDPIILRKEALERQLTLPEIARAFIHLAKRRGFKSNRKTGEARDTDFMSAIENLKENLQKNNSRTLGEYLWLRNKDISKHEHHKKVPTKFRYDKGLSDEERIFPTRDMVEYEFDVIWDTQAKHYPEMTGELKKELRGIIFFQRPLKKQIVGKCTFEREEDRCIKAHPLFQEFRLRQEINQLELISNTDNSNRNLTQEERDVLYEHLSRKKYETFEKLRKKLLGKTSDEYRFNYETENKKSMQGNLTDYAFNRNKELGAWWNKLGQDGQIKTVEVLLDDTLADEAVQLILLDLGLPAELAADALNAPLPDGYGSLSLKAIEKIIPFLRQGEKYYKACELAGYNHSDYNGEVYDQLPYYGEIKEINTLPLQKITHDDKADEFGRIGNPTVHIALNQLRRIINALIDRYGIPQDISLELARESAPSAKMVNSLKEQLGMKVVKGGYEKDSLYRQYHNLIKRVQDKNAKLNQRLDSELERQGIAVNSENRLKLKLWEELATDDFNRCCVYCGNMISRDDIFKPHIQVEHILPKSRTYDDSYANKTLSHHSCNIDKGERSPWEAFGNKTGKYDWQEICDRSANLPVNKRWRFNENAMQQYADENELIGRMLNDTRYMSKVAAQYLRYVCGKAVTPVTGKLTEELRRKWGLNKLLGESDVKERTDHRHHAIDAFVIALTDRSLVKRYADAIKRSPDRFLQGLGNPYPMFSYEQMKKQVEAIKVSYKPDQVNPAKLRSCHQTAGGLAMETAYSYVGPDPDNKKLALYSIRQDVTSLTPKDIENIKDDTGFVKEQLRSLLSSCPDEKKLKETLTEWANQNNIKKVKVILRANPDSMIPVKDKNGRIYKYYASDENLFADIYHNYNPKQNLDKWDMEIVSSYKAHQPGFTPEWKSRYPWAKLVMRLYKNDVVAYTNDAGQRELRRVRKMTYGIVYLRELCVATKPKGKEDIGEQFSANQLRLKSARKAGVDILGRYFDPFVNEQK